MLVRGTTFGCGLYFYFFTLLLRALMLLESLLRSFGLMTVNYEMKHSWNSSSSILYFSMAYVTLLLVLMIGWFKADLLHFITLPMCSSVIFPKEDNVNLYLLKGCILRFFGWISTKVAEHSWPNSCGDWKVDSKGLFLPILIFPFISTVLGVLLTAHIVIIFLLPKYM